MFQKKNEIQRTPKMITTSNLITSPVVIIVVHRGRILFVKGKGLLKRRRDDGYKNVLDEHFVDIIYKCSELLVLTLNLTLNKIPKLRLLLCHLSHLLTHLCHLLSQLFVTSNEFCLSALNLIQIYQDGTKDPIIQISRQVIKI